MYKVLLADDKEVFRRKVKRLPYWKDASDKFLICFEAQNGREALDYLETHKVDVVLTDIRMPFIDGIELLKRIKEKGLCPCVILLSEFAEFSYAKEGIINGAFDYIVKPVDQENIQDAFERAYHFLSTLKETTRMVDNSRIHDLSEAMISGNPEKTKFYAEYIGQEIFAEESGVKEQILLTNDVLSSLRQDMTSQRSYLEKYLNLDRLFSVSLAETDDGITDVVFSHKIFQILSEIKPYLVMVPNDMIKKICHISLEKVDEKIALSDLAESMYVNPKYLGGLFKQEMGCSYRQYITRLKMARAKHLLGNTDMRVFEAASMLGYEDVGYFSRLFKKEIGESPSDYREKINDGKGYQ